MKIQVFSFFNSEKKVVIVVLSGRNLDLRNFHSCLVKKRMYWVN